MPITNGPTAIPSLIGSDLDGTIVSYTIDRLPIASKGTLSIPCPPTPTGATCTGGYANLTDAVMTANFGGIVLTPSQAAGMRFAPSGNYSGTVIINYHVTDNAGLTSNTTTYIISISGVPPVSRDVVTAKLLNNSGAAAIAGLSSSDADGTIANYIITSIPPVSQGVLSLPCPPTPTGATCTAGYANLTAAVLAANTGGISLTAAQASGIIFTPSSTFTGTVLFNYAAYDNAGNLSNVATYTIPTGTASALPVSRLILTGSRSGENITAKWTSENESLLHNYELQYSINSVDYTAYKNVTAQNMAQNKYSITLFNFTEKVYYLRLKVTNLDGSYHFSNVVVVKNSRSIGITVYPVPATDHVNIRFAHNEKVNYQINLLDLSGRLLKQIIQNEIVTSQFIRLDRAGLPGGTYILQVTDLITGEQQVNKIVFE